MFVSVLNIRSLIYLLRSWKIMNQIQRLFMLIATTALLWSCPEVPAERTEVWDKSIQIFF
jgi:hypothetical protein